MSVYLGVSSGYHDSAACLVQDGRIVAAAQEDDHADQRRERKPGLLLNLP